MEGVVFLFGLLVLFQVKHFVCDYLWQTKYMLGKFKEHGWAKPLSAHAGVHSVVTMLIVISFSMPIWFVVAMGIFDFVVHFTMDRIKASPKFLGRFDIKQKQFWLSLGFDQMVHHITHYVIISFMLLEML